MEYIAGSLANGDLRDVGVEVEDCITIFEQLNGVPRSLGGRRKKASRRKYWNEV